MMHFVFYKTGDVFKAEEIFNKAGIKNTIVPTPVQDKAYCGVCIRINGDSSDLADKILAENNMEYKLIS